MAEKYHLAFPKTNLLYPNCVITAKRLLDMNVKLVKASGTFADCTYINIWKIVRYNIQLHINDSRKPISYMFKAGQRTLKLNSSFRNLHKKKQRSKPLSTINLIQFLKIRAQFVQVPSFNV